jgi:hypothetical protein
MAEQYRQSTEYTEEYRYVPHIDQTDKASTQTLLEHHYNDREDSRHTMMMTEHSHTYEQGRANNR